MRVLLGADGSAGASAAAEWVERFLPAGPSLLCIAAVARVPPVVFGRSTALGAIRARMLDRARELAEAARARLAASWTDVTLHVAEGDPHEHLLRAAEQWRAELVVLGRSAGGDESASLGSVARLAAHHLECSVLLVDRAPEAVRDVVVGIDGSASAREALRLLSQLVLVPAPRVLALGIVNTSWRRGIALEELPQAIQNAVRDVELQQAGDARAALDRAVGGLAGRATVEREVAAGNPADVLLTAARQRGAQLVAVGHQGLEPMRRLSLGSVAERLLTTAPGSLLIGRK
jgi:nucleotide-binding universal stress UspA family protein